MNILAIVLPPYIYKSLISVLEIRLYSSLSFHIFWRVFKLLSVTFSYAPTKQLLDYL